MIIQPNQVLSADALRVVFIEQLSILYNAKNSLIQHLPQLVSQATFKNLKFALEEDMNDSITQMAALKEIFRMMDTSWLTENCFGVKAVIEEALQHINFASDKHYQSDMSILIYMSAIENLQVGACEILNILALKIAYQPYAQLVAECLDTSRDNSRLLTCVAEEYFGID